MSALYVHNEIAKALVDIVYDRVSFFFVFHPTKNNIQCAVFGKFFIYINLKSCII